MRLAKETVKFLKENKGKPFFAYLSFYAVHSPIQTTEARWKKYRDKAEKIGISENGFAMGKRLPIRQHQDDPVYAGLIESMDDAVGLVLDELKKSGLDKHTIVIFTSDNGGVVSGDNYSTSNAPLRGGKGTQWEGGIREPYFISVPWMKIAGKKCDIPVSGVDFYPTILDLADLPLKPDQHQDGISILPLLKGEPVADRALIWHYPHYGNQGGDPSSIIRKGDWKLIHYYEDNHDELYNLKNDLSETTDVSKNNPEIVSRLHAELMDYLKRRGKYADPALSPRPGLILLDLNMPRKDGREALAEIKADPDLQTIPVVVLTTSKADEDIYRSYSVGASSFITKPVSFEGLVDVIRTVGHYWFEIVELPKRAAPKPE
jgi:arylsulfatase A-like enzyme